MYLRLRADQRLKQNHEDISASSSIKTVPIGERTWIDIEPGTQIDHAYPVAKRMNTLHRHGEVPREEDGAIEFWRLKDDLRNKFEYSQYWSDDVWKSRMAGGGGNKKIFQCLLIRQDKKFSTSELFKAVQDAIPLILHCGTMC